MQKKIPVFFRTAGFCLLILTLLAFLAACGGTTNTGGSNPTATTNTATSTPTSTNTPASTPTSSNPTPTATTPSGNASGVSVVNFSFSPASLTVSVGAKVTWTNNDSVTHTVTSDQGTWNSQSLAPGNTFSFTFTKAGTYTYHCNIHPSMKATIIVK